MMYGNASQCMGIIHNVNALIVDLVPGVPKIHTTNNIISRCTETRHSVRGLYITFYY